MGTLRTVSALFVTEELLKDVQVYQPEATNYDVVVTESGPKLPISFAGKVNKETAGEETTVLRISVIIAWVNPRELLDPGLDALRQQGRRADEIIVVTRHEAEQQALLLHDYPEITLISAPPRTPITALRSLGIHHSRGDVIVVTEDHCVPVNDWIETIERRMLQGYEVVGGPVENACESRLRDWAAFLTEYAGAVRAKADIKTDSIIGTCELPGNNIAYRRELAGGLCETLERGQWESFYHPKLVERGISMASDSAMLILHRRPFDFCYFITQRYHFCRSFAAMRGQTLSLSKRVMYLVGSVLLPPVLLVRGLRTIARKRRLRGRYLVCLPLIMTYLIIGAAGEMIGYGFGGGVSLGKVE